jgi:hypothetical protein
MHVCEMQMDPEGQFASARQPTQTFAVVSQTTLLAGSQSVLSVQPTPHVFVTGLQYWPVGQMSLVGKHGTHSLLAVWQNGPLGFPAQSASVVHPCELPPLPFPPAPLDVEVPLPLFPPLLVDAPPAPPLPVAASFAPAPSPVELEPPPALNEAAEAIAMERPAASVPFIKSQEDGEPRELRERKRGAMELLPSPWGE